MTIFRYTEVIYTQKRRPKVSEIFIQNKFFAHYYKHVSDSFKMRKIFSRPGNLLYKHIYTFNCKRLYDKSNFNYQETT